MLARLVLVALLFALAAPVARAQTPAASPAASIPAACRDAGGALVVTTTPFSHDRNKQARASLISPDGKPLGQFPVAGALQLIPTPVKDKVIVPTTNGETWIYDVTRGTAKRYGAPTGGPRDYSSSPSTIVAGVYLLVLKTDGWDIVDIRTGAERSLIEIAGPHARLSAPTRMLVANNGTDLLIALAVGSSRNALVEDPALTAPGSYPVVVVPGDLGKAKLLDGNVYPDATAFSPDGASLALLRSEPGVKQLYVRALGTGEERRVDAFDEATKIGGLAFGGKGVVLLENETLVTRPLTVGGKASEVGQLDGLAIDGVVSPSSDSMVVQTIVTEPEGWATHWWRLDLKTFVQTRLDADGANVADGWPREDRWLLLTAAGVDEGSAWPYALLDTETGRLTTASKSGVTAFGRVGPISGKIDGAVALAPTLADGTVRLDLIDGQRDQAWSVPIAGKENGPYTLTMTSFSPGATCAAISTTTVTEKEPLRTVLLPMRPDAKPVPLLDGAVIGWLPTAPGS